MLLPDARCGALENKTLKLHYSIKNKWHSTINNKFYPSLYSIYIILNYAKNTQEEKRGCLERFELKVGCSTKEGHVHTMST